MSTANEISSLLQEAIALHRAAKYHLAEALYLRVLQYSPTNFDALHLLGVIAKQRGDAQTAINFFGKALKVDSGQPSLYCNLGAALQELGHAVEALAAYDSAIALQPNYAMAWNNRGNALRSLGRWADAILSFEAAMERQINYSEAYFNRGITLQAMGEHEQALLDFSDALHLKRDYPEAHFACGVSHQFLLQFQEAIVSYQACVDSQASHAPAHTNLAMIFVKLQRYSEALAHLELALQIRPVYRLAHLQRGHVLRLSGRADEAILAYQSALSQSKDTDENMDEISYFLASLGVGESPLAAPSNYVKNLFDQYAAHFDTHLIERLVYQVPQLLEKTISPFLESKKYRSLDLGCGTGLCGGYLAAISDTIVGVDLSENMLQLARESGHYTRLECMEIVQFLSRPLDREEQFELMIAADVLVYIGDLNPLFSALASALSSAGLFAFSIEISDDLEYCLQASQRYAHSKKYLLRLAHAHGFIIRQMQAITSRTENEEDIQGMLVVMSR
jgi:predicted TPR repeat methyltransferase